MLKRTALALGLVCIFIYGWFALDRIPINVVGQPSSTGLIQSRLEAPFFENLAVTTGLPLDIQYRTINTLGIKDNYQLRMLKSGELDLVSLRFLQNASDEPTLLGIDLVGLTTDFATARAVVDAYSPVLDQRLQQHFNSKLLGVWPFGPQVFFCRFGIRELRDLSGRKVRVGNENFAPLIQALGGTPVVIAFDDVATSLRDGLVDCAVTSAGSGLSAGWARYSTHFLPLGTQMGLNGYVINRNLWERLSRKQQELLERAFREHIDRIWAYAQQVHDEASACIVGRPCALSEAHRLSEVRPVAGDYQRMRELLETTTLKDWASRCDRVHPGCADDWRARVAPILRAKGNRP